MFEHYFRVEAIRSPLKALNAGTAQGMFSRAGANLYKPAELQDNYDLYLDNDLVRQSVDDLTESAVGKGFYTSVKTQRQVSERTANAAKAKELVDDFGQEFNLDERFANISKNMLIAGFLPMETRLVPGDVDKCALKLIHPLTVKEVKMDNSGEKLEYILQRVDGNDVKIEGKAIAWYCYSPLGNDPCGVSFVRGMTNVLNTLNTITDDVDALLERYISPVGIWKSTGGLGRLDALKKAVTERRAGEDIFLDNLTPEEMARYGLVEFLNIEPRVPFWEYIMWLYERAYSYTRANNLAFVRNTTEASSKKMDEIVGRHYAYIQRILKRTAERYWYAPLVELNNLSEVPRLNWGQEKTAIADIQLERFLTAGVQAGYLDRTQFTDILLQLGVKVPEPSTDEPVPPMQRPNLSGIGKGIQMNTEAKSTVELLAMSRDILEVLDSNLVNFRAELPNIAETLRQIRERQGQNNEILVVLTEIQRILKAPPREDEEFRRVLRKLDEKLSVHPVG